jgi:hypothetical protein
VLNETAPLPWNWVRVLRRRPSNSD